MAKNTNLAAAGGREGTGRCVGLPARTDSSAPLPGVPARGFIIFVLLW